MPNWDEIRKEWETTSITFKALAEKHGVKDSTIRSRKNREKWQRNATGKNATQRKNVATEKKKLKKNTKSQKEPIIKNDELNDKQRLFCIYYTKYWNATKAYQKAYECAYSTAMVEGHRHLRNPKINAEIDRIREEQTYELKLDARAILQKYIDIAFADITDYTVFGKKEIQVMGPFGPLKDENGNPIMKEVNYVDFKESSMVDGTIITEAKQGKDGVAIKLADKMKALDKLDKYLELLPESTRLKVQEEKMKHDMAMKEKEIDLKQKEIENKNAPPETPDIHQYLEALKGEIKDVFDDE